MASYNLYNVVSDISCFLEKSLFERPMAAIEDKWNPLGDCYDIESLSEELAAGEQRRFLLGSNLPLAARAMLLSRLRHMKGTERGMRLLFAMIGVRARAYPGWLVKEINDKPRNGSMMDGERSPDEERYLARYSADFSTIPSDDQGSNVYVKIAGYSDRLLSIADVGEEALQDAIKDIVRSQTRIPSDIVFDVSAVEFDTNIRTSSTATALAVAVAESSVPGVGASVASTKARQFVETSQGSKDSLIYSGDRFEDPQDHDVYDGDEEYRESSTDGTMEDEAFAVTRRP